MDLNFPRPMLNSPCGSAAGNAFYARVVRRVDAWRGDRRILNKVLAEMQEKPNFYDGMMRQEIRCNCSSCRRRADREKH
jgi:hypothetical protein